MPTWILFTSSKQGAHRCWAVVPRNSLYIDAVKRGRGGVRVCVEKENLFSREQYSISYLCYNLCSNCLDVSVFLEPLCISSGNMTSRYNYNNRIIFDVLSQCCVLLMLILLMLMCGIISAWYLIDVLLCARWPFFRFHWCILSRKSKIYSCEIERKDFSGFAQSSLEV